MELQISHSLTDSNLNHTGIYLYSKGKIMIHLTFDYKTDEKCTTPGQYLKYHRTFQGLTTRELAEKVGIVPATLVMYENDRHPIKYKTAVALANALGIDRIPRYDENGRQRSNIYKIVVPQELPHEANTFTDDVDQLKGRELQVYMFIHRKCGSRGYRVSRQKIAEELNISRSTVSRITRKLAAGGWIDKAYAGRPFGGGRGWNRYAISHIRINARCRIIFWRLVLQAAAQETAHFAARISFGVGMPVTPLTKLKESKKYLLNKGKVKDKSILKAISKRVERLRKIVKNGMCLEKVRAFFNRLRKGRDGPPEKLPGAPSPSALSSKFSAPGRTRKILDLFGRIGYHRAREPERKEEAKWQK